MLSTTRFLKLSAIATIVAVGAGPSCATDDLPLRPQDRVYQTYEAPRGPGPGIGCNRNPPPSQC